jgi:hypothetical protein
MCVSFPLHFSFETNHLRHVDGRVTTQWSAAISASGPAYNSPQTLHEEAVIPRELGTKTIRPRAGPLPEPVEHTLEGVLGVWRVGLETLTVLVLDIVKGNMAPLLLTVVQVPLVEEGDSAVAMSASNPDMQHIEVVELTIHHQTSTRPCSQAPSRRKPRRS